MSTQEPESRASGVAVYVLLFVLGILQGLIGSFQYSRGPAPLIAIVFDVVIFATCAGCGWAMRSFAGGVVPALGWMAASFVLSTGSTEGTVIITATAPGEWYLYGGALAAAAGAGVSFARWARPAGRPRLRSPPAPGERADVQLKDWRILSSQHALVCTVARSGAQDPRGFRADGSVSGQAVVRLEVDHVRLGDRAEHAVVCRAGFLLDHGHVGAFHEG
jgi:hypothetical protein